MTKDNTKIYCANCGRSVSAKQDGRGYRCNNCKIVWTVEELGKTKEERQKMIKDKLKEVKKNELKKS